MLDYRAVLLAVTAALNLGSIFFVYFRRKPSPTSSLFILFSGALVLWAAAWFAFFVALAPGASSYALELTYVAALLIAVSFYFFSCVFPENRLPSLAHVLLVGVPVTLLAASLLVPGALVIRAALVAGTIEVALDPRHYILFTAMFMLFFAVSMLRLWGKYLRHAVSPEERVQLLAIGSSATVVGLLGIWVDLVLGSPQIGDFRYFWTGPLFTTVIAVTVAYAVFRHRLFNTRAVIGELFLFLLWLFTLVPALLASGPDRLVSAVAFLLSVIVGSLLVRSMKAEVEARERIETANEQQEKLLHFLSHEVKGTLAAAQAGFSEIADGEAAEFPYYQSVASQALARMRQGVDMVTDILSTSNFKKGTVSYAMRPFDLRAAVTRVVAELAPEAGTKHLALEFAPDEAAEFMVVGDEAQLSRHVVRNLIDNAIKYTPSGSVRVALARQDGTIRLTVSDTGVGISAQDMSRLFTEGGRGAEAVKVNPHSTGYGLFITKSIVEAHQGRVSAASDGPGKGATFTVELPAAVTWSAR